METRRYSILPDPEPIKLHGRQWRILNAIANGPLPTADVYQAVRKKPNAPIARENPETRKRLRELRESGCITWADDTVTICEAGLQALDAAGAAVDGRRAA